MTREAKETVILDIGGTVFKTEISTLKTIPGSRLATIDRTSEYYHKESDSYYFDRDANSFRQILNAYRNGELHVAKDTCPQQFRAELEFWGIPIQMLSPCCWKSFYKTEDDLDVISALLKRLGQSMNGLEKGDIKETTGKYYTSKKGCNEKKEKENMSKSKRISSLVVDKADEEVKPQNKMDRLWLLLDDPRSSFAAKVWCFIYLAVVILNTILILIWAEPGTRVNLYLVNLENNTGNTISKPLYDLVYKDPHPVVFVLDLLCMLFFIAEAALHFYVCPKKSQYPKDVYNIVKVFLCLTMILTLILDLNKIDIASEGARKLMLVTRGLSVLRLMLVFRLHKLYQGLDILLLSVKRSFKVMFLLILAISILVVIYGSIMFSAEIGTERDNGTEMFPSVWIGMWWSIITMTTVGYGDTYPTTSFGYIIGTFCALNGLIILAMPVAAVAANFSSLYSRHNDMQKHRTAIAKQQIVAKAVKIGHDTLEMTVLENIGEETAKGEKL